MCTCFSPHEEIIRHIFYCMPSKQTNTLFCGDTVVLSHEPTKGEPRKRVRATRGIALWNIFQWARITNAMWALDKMLSFFPWISLSMRFSPSGEIHCDIFENWEQTYIRNGPKMFFFVQQLITFFNNHFRAVCIPLGESTTTTKNVQKIDWPKIVCQSSQLRKKKQNCWTLSFLFFVSEFDIFLL